MFVTKRLEAPTSKRPIPKASSGVAVFTMPAAQQQNKLHVSLRSPFNMQLHCKVYLLLLSHVTLRNSTPNVRFSRHIISI